jgi:hypothetical protein
MGDCLLRSHHRQGSLRRNCRSLRCGAVTELHLDLIYLYSKFALMCQKDESLSKLSAMFLDAVVLIMTTIGLVSCDTLCKGKCLV